MQRIANPSSSNSDARVRVSVSPQTQSPAKRGAFLYSTFSHVTQRVAKNHWEDSITHCLLLWLPCFILSPEGAERGVNTKSLPCPLTADPHGDDNIHLHF